MKDIKTLIILILCSFLCMAMVTAAGKGTYQAVVSDDGMTLIVVDTRTGGYKVCEVEPGDRERVLFSPQESYINRRVSDPKETSLFKPSKKPNLLKPSGEPSLFKTPFDKRHIDRP
ncbi:MAG: hypothetical protein JW912_03860 [Sedimentisphaerales bacterium]|nr:hypothetical protein [Sedimentisphaerales bacterium]